MTRNRCPSLVVDASIAEHFEVLRLMSLRRVGVVEAVDHAHALHRNLTDAVHHIWLWYLSSLKDRRRYVDEVVKLVSKLPLTGDPLRPMHDHPVARAAPVRCDLLRPLIRGVHRVRPADGVVIVRFRATQFVDPTRHQFDRFKRGQSIERNAFIESAFKRTLARGPVVTDDVIDERVIERFGFVEHINQSTDAMIGVLKEPGIDFHLAREHAFEFWRLSIPCGNLLRTHRKITILWNYAELFLTSNRLLAQLVPALIELPLVLIRPFLWDMMRGVRSTGREVHEERFVPREQALLANPRDRTVGHVLHEMVAFFRRLGRSNDFGALVNRRIPLARLARDKAIEIFEPRSGRPAIKRSDRARLPNWDFVALAELCRRIAVQP